MPFAATLGLQLTVADADRVVAVMTWRADLCTSLGVLHGGALMALADTTGAVCAFLNLPEGAATSTIESKTNFFRGVRSGKVTATSRPLHIGRTTIVVQTELRDDADKLVAMVGQTQIVLPARLTPSPPGCAPHPGRVWEQSPASPSSPPPRRTPSCGSPRSCSPSGRSRVFVGAGGRRHARPPVAVPTDEPTSVSGSTTPAVEQPDTERDGAV